MGVFLGFVHIGRTRIGRRQNLLLLTNWNVNCKHFWMCLLAVGSTPPKQLAIKYDQYEIIVLGVRDNTIRMYELAGCKFLSVLCHFFLKEEPSIDQIWWPFLQLSVVYYVLLKPKPLRSIISTEDALLYLHMYLWPMITIQSHPSIHPSPHIAVKTMSPLKI